MEAGVELDDSPGWELPLAGEGGLLVVGVWGGAVLPPLSSAWLWRSTSRLRIDSPSEAGKSA